MDRTWSTYDEILFVECDTEDNPTGKFVRMGVQFGEVFGLAPAHELLFLRPIARQPQALPIETASRADIEAALKQNEARHSTSSKAFYSEPVADNAAVTSAFNVKRTFVQVPIKRSQLELPRCDRPQTLIPKPSSRTRHMVALFS
jgi:hypothetical protein